MLNKRVQFDYYKIYGKTISNCQLQDEKEYDITSILKVLKAGSISSTTRECMSEKARVQSISHDIESNIWEIQFLRLRENYAPGIADDDGSYDVIKLEGNKYVGEFASALYDSKNNTLVLHRNNNSLTPSGVEEYLGKLSKGYSFKLKPVIDPIDSRSYLDHKLIRKLSIGVHTENLDKLYEGKEEDNYVTSLFRQLSKLDGGNIKIDISIGHGRKDKTLSPGLVDSIVDDLIDFNGVNELKANYKETPDTRVEPVDLLCHRVKDIVTFRNIGKDNPLEHKDVYPKMLELYNKRIYGSTEKLVNA